MNAQREGKDSRIARLVDDGRDKAWKNDSDFVKRLIVVETEEMYKARKQKEANHKAMRPPLVISHPTRPAASEFA
ncbi:hypothetical protein K1719_045163 [Acacia pycnantha]|nr:hypothetical protein K1719_045163 [Acacia pycnantha]